MKKILAILALTAQICFAGEPNLSWFYSETNIMSEQVDFELDKILEFLEQNPQRVNDEFGEFKDHLFTPFIFNSKILNTHRYDFERIEKILKFKPELNFNFANIKDMSMISMVISAGLDLYDHRGVDHGDTLRLVRLLVKNGADIKSPELLHFAYATDNFELFVYLLQNGAQIDRVMFSVGADMVIFAGQNGFSSDAREPPSPQTRAFVKSEKFIKFYESKMRYLNEILKLKSPSEFKQDEIEIFTKVCAIHDNAPMAKFLIDNKFLKNKATLETLQNHAKNYKSEEVLKLLETIKDKK